MKVSAIKGAVLLVIMKVKLHEKNIIAIFLASIYNGSECFQEVLPQLLQGGVREKTGALLLWAVRALNERRLSCH
jgi:hypothetical protein